MSTQVKIFQGGFAGQIEDDMNSWMASLKNLEIISTNMSALVRTTAVTNEEYSAVVAMVFYRSEEDYD